MSGLALPGDPTQDFNFLTQDERQQMRRFLMFPEEFPKEFKDWILQYVGVNAELQQSQVVGLSLTSPSYAEVATAENISWTSTFVDAATVGPTLDGLAKARYLVTMGANLQNFESGVISHIGLSVNGSTSTTATNTYSASMYVSANSIGAVVVRQVLIDLTEPSNSVKLQYARTGSGTTQMTASRRYLIAQRVANL